MTCDNLQILLDPFMTMGPVHDQSDIIYDQANNGSFISSNWIFAKQCTVLAKTGATRGSSRPLSRIRLGVPIAETLVSKTFCCFF